MNRSTMRGKLRRRLQEKTARLWQDSDLNEALADGLLEMEKKILSLNPDAFLWIDKADQVATQEFYEKPAGWASIIDVKVLGTGGKYESLGAPITYPESLTRADASGFQWFDFGTHFGLSPAPAANLADGIEVVWVPTLTMALDTDVPVLALMLHEGIVLYAEHFAVGEVAEQAEKTDPVLAAFLNTIPQYYQPRAVPTAFRVSGVYKGY